MSDDPTSTTDKVIIPEKTVEIGRGFLRSYWQSREPLPRMSGFEIPVYFFRRGIETVIALPMSTAITVMTISVSLFLLAGFLLILKNVGVLLEDTGTSQYVSIYLVPNFDQGKVSEFVAKLQSSSEIRTVEYVSSDEALNILRRDLGSRSGFLEGLSGDNPLPASVDIVFKRDEDGRQSISTFIELIKQKSFVDEVIYGSEWVSQMRGVLQVFHAFGVLTLMIALAIIAFLISNTIKLVIFSQRDELSIMQLVGASRSFIKIPFIVGGIIQGVVGALLSVLILQSAFFLLNTQLQGSVLFGIAIPDLVFLDVPTVILILLIGVVIGALGSFFALGRFMNV